ncbi:MAG: hypothetical protein CVV04_03185 [Firmicutes bacterium HGW-Firmicutes-9]|jgi:hypothetical protein|nr:MAG: hypothetical protein CVV04_03185 [Firmicutes bacterium HGW-Firmicutes-9]
MKRKSIQFDYLQFFYYKENKSGAMQEKLLDLAPLLQQISKKDLANTCRMIDDEEHRMQICRHDEENNFWEIQLLRQREENLPGISYEDGSYELINLPDGQYIAESSSILYDANKSIILFQRNRYGYTINALLAYIRSLYRSNPDLHAKPILKRNQIKKIKDDIIYRKVILVSDGNLDAVKPNSSLFKILSSFGVYQGQYVTVEIGMGHMRKRNLNSAPTAELIRQAYKSNSTTFLQARIAENKDTRIETIDLLNDRESVVFDINYSREKPITHDRLYKECKNNY